MKSGQLYTEELHIVTKENFMPIAHAVIASFGDSDFTSEMNPKTQFIHTGDKRSIIITSPCKRDLNRVVGRIKRASMQADVNRSAAPHVGNRGTRHAGMLIFCNIQEVDNMPLPDTDPLFTAFIIVFFLFCMFVIYQLGKLLFLNRKKK